MADIADVEAALAGVIAAALYPDGTATPSVLGVMTRIYRGWPLSSTLSADLDAGGVNISVTSAAGNDPGSRGLAPVMGWKTLIPSVPALHGAVTDPHTITLSGLARQGDVIAVTVDGSSYAAAVQKDDSLAGVASALAAMIAAQSPAASSGAVISLPDAASLSVQTGSPGSLCRELSRQKRTLMVNIWAPTPALRDQAGQLVHLAVLKRLRLYLPDQSVALLTPSDDGRNEDSPQKSGSYHRTNRYGAEFPTLEITGATPVLVPSLAVSSTSVTMESL